MIERHRRTNLALLTLRRGVWQLRHHCRRLQWSLMLWRAPVRIDGTDKLLGQEHD